MKKGKKKKGKWGLKEFVAAVDEVMVNQEKENPPLKQVHARLSPEWRRVSDKLAKLLTLTEEKAIEALREEIVEEGEIATRVLIDLLLAIANQGHSKAG